MSCVRLLDRTSVECVCVCVQEVETQLVARENQLHKLTQIKDTILRSCHPNALPVIKQSFAILEAAWHRVSQLSTIVLSAVASSGSVTSSGIVQWRRQGVTSSGTLMSSGIETSLGIVASSGSVTSSGIVASSGSDVARDSGVFRDSDVARDSGVVRE